MNRIIFAIALVSLIAGPAKAATVFFNQSNATVDATFIASHPAYPSNSNFNGAGTLFVDGSADAHALIRFGDYLGAASGLIAPGTIVTEAFVRLRTTDAYHAASTALHTVSEVTTTWDVDTVTYDNFGGAPGVQVGSDVSSSISAVFTPNTIDTFFHVDITALVQGWINGATNHGIEIYQASGDGTSFYSDKDFVLGYEPTLMINYDVPVPAPASLFLFLMSLSLLAFRRGKLAK
jgi:hypothetical protein